MLKRGLSFLPQLCFLLATVVPSAILASENANNRGVELWQQGRTSEAVTLWLPRAEQGDGEAALFLGFAYRTGQGVDRNDSQAFRWYKRAAESGMPEAQIELSLMYELGVGTEPDPAAAASWYSLATREEFCPSELPAGGRLGPR